MENNTIWIINQYASTPETGFGGRHYYLANELANKGHEVYLISARYTHNLREPLQFDEFFYCEKNGKITNVWVNVPEYEKVHGASRVLNWFIFAFRITKLPSHVKSIPNVIYYSSLSLVGYLGAFFLSRRLSIPIIFEVRDIWPQTLIEMSNVSKYHPFVLFLKFVERFAYKTADYFLSNLPNAISHLKNYEISEENFAYLPNGICLEEMSVIELLSDEMQLSLQQYNNKLVIGYIGTVGFANALDVLIESAFLLNQNNNIQFVLIGDGSEKTKLIQIAQEHGLTNIEFFDAIPKKQVQAAIKYFDVCYLGWRDKPLYEFGIGANKLPEYLFSGKPVLHSFSGKGDPIAKFSAGISVPAEKPEKVVEAIHKFVSIGSIERALMGERGHQAAIDFYSYQSLGDKLQKVIEGLLGGR